MTEPKTPDPLKVLMRRLGDGMAVEPEAAIGLLATILDDIEGTRKATANRYEALIRSTADKDGEIRGWGLDRDNPFVLVTEALLKRIADAENAVIAALEAVVKKHWLGPWIANTKGIGPKQGGRLLGAIGDPYIRPEIVTADGEVIPAGPRTVSALWKYCGLDVHDDGTVPRRTRGQKSNWSTAAKTRAYLVAQKCMQNLAAPCAVQDGDKWATHVEDCTCSPYRLVYDAARLKHMNAVHKQPCVRCGPAGHPAEPGSPLSEAHKMARALREVSKEVLKDLWRAAKAYHEAAESETS